MHKSNMNTYDQWLAEMTRLSESRKKNIQKLKDAKHLDESQLRTLDSTLRKVTAFTKKLKNIGSTSAAQFMPDLDKLNLTKYLDEIAGNICEAKIKTSDLEALIEFCVKLASLYKEFPAHLIQEFRKTMPTRKGNKIENPSKLRVDLRFFSELLLNGMFIILEKEGLQLLGSVIVYLLETDKQEHVNTSILLPFCRNAFFPITGVPPQSIVTAAEAQGQQIPREQLISMIISDEKRGLIVKIFNEYWDSLVNHTNKARNEMNKLNKSIKRQERTRGDASADDKNRQRYEQAKQNFERLHQSSIELSECLNRSMPEMSEETSEDEREAEAATRRLNAELSEGRVMLWPDRDTQIFYESLWDVTAYVPTAATQEADAAAAAAEQQKEPQIINESIDNVDLSCLEEPQHQQAETGEVPITTEMSDEEDELDNMQMQQEEHGHEVLRQRNSSSPVEATLQTVGAGGIHQIQGTTINFQHLLEVLPHCINRDLIDSAALDFLKNYARNKGNRKRLINHFLQAPVDRLDLLPFYARFLATIRQAYPDIPTQILHELLSRFRAISQKNVEIPKKSEMQKVLAKIESKLHLCAFLSELCKFGILPKAEALTCLRSLLVQMRVYKVDMLCVMIEQLGPFLYRSPDAHSKMTVIMQVLKEKSANIKDPRQTILLENAYFAVIPPSDDQNAEAGPKIQTQSPMQEFIKYKLANEIRVSIFRRINWDDEELREFTLKLLTSPWRIHFDQLACLASLVSALGDHHDWISIRVLDDVLEFIRLSLELNLPSWQQQAQSTIIYFGQLFNYNVSNTATLFKILYQIISLGIQQQSTIDEITPDQLLIRLQRIRLATQLVDTVCEFFCTGKSKKRLDNFLYFFLRFYHQTRDCWSQFVDDLGEFPEDVEQNVTDLLGTWRKGEQFPQSLNEANAKVTEIEELYKAKVEEVLAGMRMATESRKADAEDGERRLNRIMEEDEERMDSDEETEDFDDDDDEEGTLDEEDDEEGERHKKQKHDSMEPFGGDELPEIGEGHGFNDEEQILHVRVHTQQPQILPEDEDFMRDFDRLMTESFQSAPVTLQGPMSDLIVPPQAKQKFERKLTFAAAESSSPSAQKSRESNHQFEFGNQERKPQTSRMALMLRTQTGKGGSGGTGTSGKSQVLLKPVQMAGGENMAEKWRKAKEEQERDRLEMKKLTLAMNDRMTQEAEERHRQQQIADIEKKITFIGQTSGGSGGATSNWTGIDGPGPG